MSTKRSLHGETTLDRSAVAPAHEPAAGHRPVGRRSRRVTAAVVVLIAAVNLAIAAAFGLAVWFHPLPTPVPTAAAVPIELLPPATVPGLLAAVTTDPAAAGVDGPVLRDDLTAVASSTGEVRRQAASRVLALVANGQLVPDFARAATTATTPYTVLNAPVDLIADLSPDPAAGGPNAHFLLACMEDLQGKSPDRQREEADEVRTRITAWARNGGIQPDLVAAAIRIVTPVANGSATFTDAQTGFDPARPRPDDDTDRT